jgi:hypothetical protein
LPELFSISGSVDVNTNKVETSLRSIDVSARQAAKSLENLESRSKTLNSVFGGNQK